MQTILIDLFYTAVLHLCDRQMRNLPTRSDRMDEEDVSHDYKVALERKSIGSLIRITGVLEQGKKTGPGARRLFNSC